MARNPLYPRSAGETAMDKLLNQTLPRILADRQNRKREDEQFDYRKAQDIKAEQRYADSVTVAAEKTAYDRGRDDIADIRRAINFAKQAEVDGNFSSAYNHYTEAQGLADEKGLTDTFKPIIDKSMNTGMVEAGNDNRFDSIFVKLKNGDDATFNKGMDDYLKMSSQGRISDANEKRFKSLELLESKKTDNRFKSYYGSEVTDDYKDFNKQYQTNVLNKVGLSNKKDKPAEFAQQAQFQKLSTDEYYEQIYGAQDREAAKLFLRTEVVGSESFKNLYNNSSETMKQALNKTIVDANMTAYGKEFRDRMIADGKDKDHPSYGKVILSGVDANIDTNVLLAVQERAFSPENLPGVKVKTNTKPITRKEAEAIGTSEGSPSITPKSEEEVKEEKEIITFTDPEDDPMTAIGKKSLPKKDEEVRQKKVLEFQKLMDKGFTNLDEKGQNRFKQLDKELKGGKKAVKNIGSDKNESERRKNITVKLQEKIEKDNIKIKNLKDVLRTGKKYTSQRASGPVTAYRSIEGSDFYLNNKTKEEILKMIKDLESRNTKVKKAIDGGGRLRSLL
tara:strand:+ start:6677 stop:8362 length:1686 start_codon:yes stop_codon:yes gene_type:complete